MPVKQRVFLRPLIHPGEDKASRAAVMYNDTIQGMKLHLNFQSPLPLYQQIAQQVAVQIASGGYPAGRQLPTVRELAAELGIHFNTVSRAYQQLEEQGWTSSQPGRGTFVLPQASRRTERAQRLDLLDTLTRQYLCLVEELGFRKKEIQERIKELERMRENR